MPIIDLQQRIRELGRIRIGQQVPTQKGGTRPAKLEKFRLTSPSRPLLEKVAALYGGEVREWASPNGPQWEVFTEAERLPILVPPQPVSQWYELWSGGGCQRRCDGVREIIQEKPCICALADERACKPTTRLNVVLKDVEGIGVFRLETHGYYAATELPQVASFLEQAGGYVSATLILEQRTVNKVGEATKRFMVPGIEIEGVTPGQLVSGQVSRPEVAAGAAPQAVTGERPAIAAGAPGRNFVAEIKAAKTRDEIVQIWQAAKAANAPAKQIEEAAAARAAELDRQVQPAPEPVRDPDVHIKAALAASSMDELSAALNAAKAAGFAHDLSDLTEDLVAQAFIGRRRLLLAGPEESEPSAPAAPVVPPPASSGETDALWSQIVGAYSGDRLADLEQEFSERFGVLPGQASAEQLAQFLADMTAPARTGEAEASTDGPPF